MNEHRNTKEDIQHTALNLFSQRGYSAVSIRDICRVVGIKESTVYYHFKNKQDIFDVLLTEFEEITDTASKNFDRALATATQIEEEPFIMVGLAFLNHYLLDEKILKFIRMLMIEQHGNVEAASLYHKVLFEAPIHQNTAVFEVLMKKGWFRKNDAHSLAVEYYAPIFLVFQALFACGEITAANKEQANSILTVHLKNFYTRYYLQFDNEEGTNHEGLQE